MMKKFHLCKATDLYDCGTATFGIAKVRKYSKRSYTGNYGPRGGGVTAILFTGMYHWRIDWMGFNATFSSISAAWRIENWPKLRGNFAIFYMLAKYVLGDIKYIFTKFYRHISTNEANRKFVILISNFSIRPWCFSLIMHCGIEI